MGSVYAFPTGGEEAVRSFRRKLYNAWILDLKNTGACYDITIRCARADRKISLLPAGDGAPRDLTAEAGSFFLIFTSETPVEGLLEAAAAASGAGIGPFVCPLEEEGFTVTEVVTFKR